MRAGHLKCPLFRQLATIKSLNLISRVIKDQMLTSE